MSSANEESRLFRTANRLAVFTVIYNLAEGIISLWRGSADETLSLFGFGMDSLIEVVSALGVWHMIRRISAGQEEKRDVFERRALQITGSSFYLLTAGLILTAAVDLYYGHRPETTLWGTVISLVSLGFMGELIRRKTRVGRALHSDAILADAACSRVCAYLSLVLLAASVGYQVTGIGSLDSLGALLLAWFSWREARESFAKARGLCCSCGCAPKGASA